MMMLMMMILLPTIGPSTATPGRVTWTFPCPTWAGVAWTLRSNNNTVSATLEDLGIPGLRLVLSDPHTEDKALLLAAEEGRQKNLLLEGEEDPHLNEDLAISRG